MADLLAAGNARSRELGNEHYETRRAGRGIGVSIRVAAGDGDEFGVAEMLAGLFVLVHRLIRGTPWGINATAPHCNALPLGYAFLMNKAVPEAAY